MEALPKNKNVSIVKIWTNDNCEFSRYEQCNAITLAINPIDELTVVKTHWTDKIVAKKKCLKVQLTKVIYPFHRHFMSLSFFDLDK